MTKLHWEIGSDCVRLPMMSAIGARNDSVEIRRATDRDAEGVFRCLESAFEPYRESYTAGAYRETVPTAERLKERFNQLSTLVAITNSGEIAATLSFSVSDGVEGHLRGFAVLPEYLGSGIAGRLLITAERELRAIGCSLITLDTTEPLQRAIRFYRKHGYQPSGRVGEFFGMTLIEYCKPLRDAN